MRSLRSWFGETLLDLRRFSLLLAECLRLGVFPFADLVPFAGYRRLTFAVRLRRVLEDLGLTYLKLGQFLALRFDILPREVCEELNRLFESVAPMPPTVSRAIVEGELGGPLETFFLEFAPMPIAAASVAQVHRAVLRDGRQVAVKIQREGLEPIFRADIRNLVRAARLVDAMGLFGRLSAQGMVREFAEWTLRELDFRLEGVTSERMAREVKSFVIIPRVEWRLSTRRILTMDYVEGISVSNLSHLLEKGGMDLVHAQFPGLDLDLSLRRFADACLSQLFVYGFFHGDPHPGNIMLRDDNRVAFLDFGIFGSLTAAEREVVAGQTERLSVGDIEGSFQCYSRQLTPTEDTDYEKFRSEALEVLGRWYHTAMDPKASIRERHLAKYTAEMIEVSRRNHLRYGMNYLLFWRSLNHLNATLWLVAPDYDLMGQLRSFFEEIRPSLFERVRTAVLSPAAKSRWAELVSGAPSDLGELLGGYLGTGGSRGPAVFESAKRTLDTRGRMRWEGLAVMSLPVAIVAASPSAPPAVRISLCAVFVLGLVMSRGPFR
jgi:ubiquinone biosynthesis protein